MQAQEFFVGPRNERPTLWEVFRDPRDPEIIRVVRANSQQVMMNILAPRHGWYSLQLRVTSKRSFLDRYGRIELEEYSIMNDRVWRRLGAFLKRANDLSLDEGDEECLTLVGTDEQKRFEQIHQRVAALAEGSVV